MVTNTMTSHDAVIAILEKAKAVLVKGEQKLTPHWRFRARLELPLLDPHVARELRTRPGKTRCDLREVLKPSASLRSATTRATASPPSRAFGERAQECYTSAGSGTTGWQWMPVCPTGVTESTRV